VKNIFFTADLHFLHPKIVDICNRPTTMEEHDEWLIDIWNSTVNKKQTVYILGDVSMGNKEKTDKILDRLHGKKHLILGNHDKNIHNSTRFETINQVKDFNYSQDGMNLHIVLFHYPIASWNRKVHGSAHLYGHTHGRYQNCGLSFDIGIDANDYRILSLEEVYDKLTKISLSLF